jgi:hypothetical protein
LSLDFILLKTNALALMGTASFLAGVQPERYSGQQETASENLFLKENFL